MSWDWGKLIPPFRLFLCNRLHVFYDIDHVIEQIWRLVFPALFMMVLLCNIAFLFRGCDEQK